MTEILYVAGPMSGLPDFNRAAFSIAAFNLRSAGYLVINPADNEIEQPNSDDAWQQYMRLSISQIAVADGVAYLPGWPQSRGASLEIFLATQIGIAVKPVAEWRERSTRTDRQQQTLAKVRTDLTHLVASTYQQRPRRPVEPCQQCGSGRISCRVGNKNELFCCLNCTHAVGS